MAAKSKTKKNKNRFKKFWFKNYYIIIPVFVLVIMVLAVFFNDIHLFEVEEWDNPPIICSSKSDLSITKLYPLEMDYQSGLKNDPLKMTAYCKSMQSVFNESDMGIAEAEDLYQIIHDENLIRDSYADAVSPDLTLDELTQRIAVKKIDKNTYEVFYVYYECGFRYVYQRIYIENELIKNIDRLESWKSGEKC